jgi:cytochrome c553
MAALLGLWGSGIAAEPPAKPQAAQAVSAALNGRHRALLDTYCVECHGAKKQKGKFRIDQLPLTIGDLATAERWQKVLNALNAGEMPPDEARQVERGAKADFLDDLAHTLVAARKNLGDQHGVIAMRRLNRREYRNTLRDLLGVDIDVSELPADTSARTFDTIGAGLFLSATQFEQYESLGGEALDEAFRTYAAAPVPRLLRIEAESTLASFIEKNKDNLDKYTRANAWAAAVAEAAGRPENAQAMAALRAAMKTDQLVNLRHEWAKIPGAPGIAKFGFDPNEDVQAINELAENSQFIAYEKHYLAMPGLDRGAYLTMPGAARSDRANNHISLQIPGDWPVGDYLVRVRAAATAAATGDRGFLEFGADPDGGSPPISAHQVVGTMAAPEVIEIPFTLKRNGSRTVYIRERGVGRLTEALATFAAAQRTNGIGPDLAIWVDWLEIEPRRDRGGGKPPGIAALGTVLGNALGNAQPAREELRSALARFMHEAYRGAAVTPGAVERLLAIHDAKIAGGVPRQQALKEVLTAVLSSPLFLYRAEPEVHERHRALTGDELATRLAYFLWGSPPDAGLRELAERGDLLHAAVLAAQVDRLLNDARSYEFVTAFVSQWLSMDRLDLFQFDRRLHPRFDDHTKENARQEVYQTFAHLVKNDRSVTDLLKADYVVINGLLAHYYGIEGVAGDAFRPVPLPAGSPRGGLLGMAAILAMGSNGERTNPVERGAWVLRKLLNDPPPPAPANVPEIARLARRSLTTRERLKAHQEDAQCASCHRKIDPIGFGMENFDAVGLWRTEDSCQAMDANGVGDPNTRRTWTIDPAAVLYHGPAFQTFTAMRDLIAARKDDFAKGFSVALIEYALGRPCGFSDETLIADMVSRAKAKGFSVRAFIQALVLSDEFRAK